MKWTKVLTLGPMLRVWEATRSGIHFVAVVASDHVSLSGALEGSSVEVEEEDILVAPLRKDGRGFVECDDIQLEWLTSQTASLLAKVKANLRK